MPVSLEVPILENGLQFVNFFEGRVLTGRDLRDQALADRRQRLLVGRAAGAGIVSGLEVALVTAGGNGVLPVVKVQAGLALNGLGEPLLLCQPEDVVLLRAPREADGSDQIFAVCTHPEPGAQIPSGIGFYVLVIKPGSGFEGEAPRSGLADQGIAAGCGKRYATLGVQFRLVPFDPMQMAGLANLRNEIASLAVATAPAAKSRLRNILASACLGSFELPAFAVDAWPPDNGPAPFVRYGALDYLRSAGLLLDCEIPLALLSWTMAGIGFLDMWAARRRVTRDAIAGDWPLIASDRRRSDTEATFFQFEQHLQSLLQTVPDPETIQAKEYFRFLPPAGFLRLTDETTTGIDPAVFFNGLQPDGPHPLAGVSVLPLLDASHAHHAIDLAASTPPLIWRYTVPENVAASYEVFATGYLPYQGDPRFEITTDQRLDELEDKVDAIGSSVGTAPGKGTIKGTVFDRSGAVVIGIRVTVTNKATAAVAEAMTNSSGRYSVPNLPAGMFVVGVPNGAGTLVLSQEVTLQAGETKTVDLAMQPLKGTGGLVGTLVDASSRPLSHRVIDIVDDSGFRMTITTGPDGGYETGPLPPGNYRIEIASAAGVEKTPVKIKKGATRFVGLKLAGRP